MKMTDSVFTDILIHQTVWSAEMFLLFHLRRLDVFSTGDLGIQRGMAVLAGKNVKALKTGGKGKWKYMAEKEMLEMAEKFKYVTLFSPLLSFVHSHFFSVWMI